MSAGSLGGGISVVFSPETSQIDSFLAGLRQGVSAPVRFAPAVGSPPLSAHLSPQQAAATFPGLGLNSTSFGPPAVGPPPSGGAFNQQGAQQWQQAAQQFNQAAQAMQRAMQFAQQVTAQLQQAAAVPSGAASSAPPSTGGSGGNNRIMGLRPGGLLRYATAGFLLREGMSVIEAAQEYSAQQTLARTPMQRLQAEMSLANRITSVPVVGQLAGIIAHPLDVAARAAVQRAEEGQRDLDAQIRLGQAERERLTGREAMDREAGRYGLIGSRVRQAQAARDRLPDAEQRYRDQFFGLRDQANATADPAEHNRIVREMWRLNREHPAEMRSITGLVGAETAELERLTQRDIRHSLNFGPADSARAEGRIGIARRRELEARLLNEASDAYEIDPRLGRRVEARNRMQLTIDDEEMAERTRRRQASYQENRLRIERQPLQSQFARIEEERRQERREARPEEFDAIDRESQSRHVLARQRWEDDMDRSRLSIRAQTESLYIRTGYGDTRNLSPGTRANLANINDIVRGTQEQEFAALLSGRGGLVSDIARLGRAQLQGARSEYLRGFQGVEISPSRTALSGPTTEDAGATLKDIQDALTKLSDVPQTLKDIRDKLGGLVIGP